VESLDAGGSSRSERKALEKKNITFKVGQVLKKPEAERSEEEAAVLQLHRDTVDELCRRQIRRNILKRKQEEVFDDTDELKSKVRQLAVAVKQAKNLVVYTGAGISTAASIPDYRGPNGVWTQLQKGHTIRHVSSDLMCVCCVCCDPKVNMLFLKLLMGLHLRSGLPRHAYLNSMENMFIEVCTICSPVREYVRLFDVTERTSLHRHGTGRKCSHCSSELRDTIVHFGERGTLEQPLNWRGAAEAAKMADVIICLGSSLKVLKKYACLWSMNRPAAKRPKLYIVNLQWTPKDDLAVLKINGKCDDVMELLMEELNIQIPSYDRTEDPIFSIATPLQPEEVNSHSREVISPPSGQEVSAADPGGQTEATVVQGGWFGRGYGKEELKEKSRVVKRA
uniref:Regulatory protein SIR2 homolog 7 n=1 Tax=Sphaeramia orbicularis TaxID=375764 RepID=A0A672YCR5_9TELE